MILCQITPNKGFDVGRKQIKCGEVEALGIKIKKGQTAKNTPKICIPSDGSVSNHKAIYEEMNKHKIHKIGFWPRPNYNYVHERG